MAVQAACWVNFLELRFLASKRREGDEMADPTWGCIELHRDLRQCRLTGVILASSSNHSAGQAPRHLLPLYQALPV